MGRPVKPAAPKAAASAPRKPGKPFPGVERGDEVYFKAGDQHSHGRVASHGAHGCHIDHEGGRSRVYWEDILGHKSRSAKSAKVLNQGDDGFLMEDDHGRRRFVAGEPPAPQREDEPGDHDAVLEHARKATPLAKALGQLDELVKSHVAAYTKKDGTFVAAHDDKRVKRAPGAATGQRSLLDQPAKKPHVTETPAFKKWFGDSKVVDASGKPLVMYHGTSIDKDFSKFKVGSRGAWFASSQEVANEYAEQNDSQEDKYNQDSHRYEKLNHSGRIMPVYLKVENPYVLTSEDRFKVNTANYAKAQRELFARVRELGHDGILWNNALNKEWVLLGDPTQIKSAIGNNGNFDPESPSMTKSIQPPDGAALADAPRVLFFKGGPLANRPGLMQKKITDKTGRQTTRWVRTNHDAPANDNGGGDPGDKRGAAAGYGTHDIQPGSRVKFKAGEHAGEGEVTAVGEHGVTAKDATGREHQVLHHEVTHFQAGESVKQPDVKNSVLGEQKPIPAAQFGAADYAKSHDQADVSPESVLKNFPPDTGERIKAAQDRLAGIEQTIEQFKKDGKWAAQREVLHHKIMSELLSPERVQAATPAEGEKPRFVILGGRGGSGKSSFAGAVYDPAKCIVLDADHIKGMIPEYEGWNASAVHEESGEIFDNAVRLCRELGLNTVLDKTMKTAKSAIADVQAFKDAGYRTEAHYMHLPRQEAAKRAVGRFLGGGEKGRYVPVEVVLANTTNESAFDQVKGMVDAWSFRDNNVPKGSKPILISQSGGEDAAKGRKDADEKKGDGLKKAGDSFVVYRAGAEHDKDLSGRNAGNADGVANHLVRMHDPDGPAFASGGDKATHVHAYRVKLKGDMSDNYENIARGAKDGAKTGGAVGRRDLSFKKNGDYAYSFPHGGDYEAEHIGAVPIADVEKHLNEKHGAEDELSDHGTGRIGKAIRSLHGHSSEDEPNLKKSADDDTMILLFRRK